MTFPASLPIMIGAEVVLFFAWIFHKKHYKYIIERVYLYPGNLVQFYFSNKIRRAFKNNEAEESFNSPEELKTQPHGENG